MWLTFAKYNQKIDVDSQELISNLSIFSDSNPNCGRFLFINYINLIGLWAPWPNKGITKTITSGVSIVTELSKTMLEFDKYFAFIF